MKVRIMKEFFSIPTCGSQGTSIDEVTIQLLPKVNLKQAEGMPSTHIDDHCFVLL